jgi:hypothetical protein
MLGLELTSVRGIWRPLRIVIVYPPIGTVVYSNAQNRHIVCVHNAMHESDTHPVCSHNGRAAAYLCVCVCSSTYVYLYVGTDSNPVSFYYDFTHTRTNTQPQTHTYTDDICSNLSLSSSMYTSILYNYAYARTITQPHTHTQTRLTQTSLM